MSMSDWFISLPIPYTASWQYHATSEMKHSLEKCLRWWFWCKFRPSIFSSKLALENKTKLYNLEILNEDRIYNRGLNSRFKEYVHCSLQKRSIRYISNAKREIIHQLSICWTNILKFHDLVSLDEICFMYKYVNKWPSSFNDRFVKPTNLADLLFSNGGCQKVVPENTSPLFIA